MNRLNINLPNDNQGWLMDERLHYVFVFHQSPRPSQFATLKGQVLALRRSLPAGNLPVRTVSSTAPMYANTASVTPETRTYYGRKSLTSPLHCNTALSQWVIDSYRINNPKLRPKTSVSEAPAECFTLMGPTAG